MKLRKPLYYAGASLALAAAAGYCWLNCWRWGGAPEPHSGFSAEEALILQSFDSYMTGGEGLAVLGLSLEETEEDAAAPLLTRLRWRLEAAHSLRSRGCRARKNLHAFMESGLPGAPDFELLLVALRSHDFPLIKIMVEKGLNPSRSYATEYFNFTLLEMVVTVSGIPLAERISFLDWLYARGIDFSSLDPDDLLRSVQIGLECGEDAPADVLAWFLRRGYSGLKVEDVAETLLSSPVTMKTLQGLLEEGILPPPGEDWLNVELLYNRLSSFPPNSAAVHWLLSHHMDINAVRGDMSGTVLDTCLRHLSYMQRGLDAETDSLINEWVAELDALLAHGAVNSAETRELLPVDEALSAEIVALFCKHGIALLAGENPCNACCTPE